MRANNRMTGGAYGEHSVALAVLSVQKLDARCRMLTGGQAVTWRLQRRWDAVPGEVALVAPGKGRKLAGTLRISGTLISTRLETSLLGLTPLRLQETRMWDPDSHYWGDPDVPIGRWARPMIKRGPRQAYEMEQVLPGFHYDHPDNDPIGISNDLKAAGDHAGAYRVLNDLCEADLRCLDAHAHLGNLAFDRRPEVAVRHYEAGFRIGELSLWKDFDGLLPWGNIDNRPVLRCMHGYALCAWRLGRFGEAGRIFRRMLWQNPADNQGVRFVLADVRAQRPWEPEIG